MERATSDDVILGVSVTQCEDRRRSQSSSLSQCTASVQDLSEEDSSSIPPIDDVRSEDGNLSSDHEHECRSECDNISRYTTSERELMDWTKRFHSLVEEAPLLEATIIGSSSLQNGVRVSKNESENGGGKERLCEGDYPELDKCDWVDPQLLEEGRRFVRRNFFAVFLANLIGIAFLLTVRPIQSLLLRTGALHRKENSMRRYVKLIMFLKRFYEEPSILVNSSKVVDSSDNGSGDKVSNECRNEIAQIQHLQRNAARNFKVYVPPPWEDLKLSIEEQQVYHAIQEDTKQLDGICTNTKFMPKILFTVNPSVPLSQYDLVVIQYAFFALLAQYPQVFGVYSKCDRDGYPEGLKGYIHLWAVLGHVFGIDPKFNLCIPRNFDPETNQLIFKQVLLYSLKSINETALRLWRAMTNGSSKYLFFFRTKAMMLFMCKDVAQLDNCKHLHSVMKPTERFSYYLYKFLVNWVLWVPPFRVAFNLSLRLSLRICQYFIVRAKKCERKWESPTSISVIEPPLTKQVGIRV